jgi:hypothetical protein
LAETYIIDKGGPAPAFDVTALQAILIELGVNASAAKRSAWDLVRLSFDQAAAAPPYALLATEAQTTAQLNTLSDVAHRLDTLATELSASAIATLNIDRDFVVSLRAHLCRLMTEERHRFPPSPQVEFAPIGRPSNKPVADVADYIAEHFEEWTGHRPSRAPDRYKNGQLSPYLLLLRRVFAALDMAKVSEDAAAKAAIARLDENR